MFLRIALLGLIYRMIFLEDMGKGPCFGGFIFVFVVVVDSNSDSDSVVFE